MCAICQRAVACRPAGGPCGSVSRVSVSKPVFSVGSSAGGGVHCSPTGFFLQPNWIFSAPKAASSSHALGQSAVNFGRPFLRLTGAKIVPFSVASKFITADSPLYACRFCPFSADPGWRPLRGTSQNVLRFMFYVTLRHVFCVFRFTCSLARVRRASTSEACLP